jgi:hypothetical protein
VKTDRERESEIMKGRVYYENGSSTIVEGEKEFIETFLEINQTLQLMGLEDYLASLPDREEEEDNDDG